MAAAAPIALGMAVVGKLYQGYETNKADRRQSKLDAENGRLTLKAGEQQVGDVLRQGYFDTGAAASQMASSGLAFGGSVGTVLADSANQVGLDIQRVREKARADAANYYAQAAEDKRAGKAALIGSAFSALSTAIGGISDIHNAGKLAAQSASENAAKLGGSTLSVGRTASPYGGGGF